MFIFLLVVIFTILLLTTRYHIIPRLYTYKNTYIIKPLDFPEHTKQTIVNITEYNLSKKEIDNIDPSSFPENLIQNTKFAFFFTDKINKKGYGYQWMFTFPKNEYNSLESWIIETLQPVIKIFESESVFLFKFRLSTVPWKFNAHFDSYDQYLVEIYGYRRCLLWHGDSFSKQDYFHIQLYNIDEIKNYLNTRHIKYFDIIIKPGQYLYIPAFWIHRTEALNNTKYCMLLNVMLQNTSKEKEKEYQRYNKLFHEYYPRRSSAFSSNNEYPLDYHHMNTFNDPSEFLL